MSDNQPDWDRLFGEHLRHWAHHTERDEDPTGRSRRIAEALRILQSPYADLTEGGAFYHKLQEMGAFGLRMLWGALVDFWHEYGQVEVEEILEPILTLVWQELVAKARYEGLDEDIAMEGLREMHEGAPHFAKNIMVRPSATEMPDFEEET